MTTVTLPRNGRGRQNGTPDISPEDQEQLKLDFMEMARKIRQLYSSDQKSTKAIHTVRVEFLLHQFREHEAEKRRVMLSRNLDFMAEFGRIVEKREAIENEMQLARREYQEQMNELEQRLDASLAGLAQEAKDAGIRGPCNFKDDSITG